MSAHWMPVAEGLPEDVAEDYFAYTCSPVVLVVDGGTVRTGYLMRWQDNEYPPEWKEQGRDGYTLDDVTHWMPLPEPPKGE